MQTVEVEAWVIVDANGDSAVGADAQHARDRYTDDIGALEEGDGFRMVKVILRVPVPECQTIALDADIPVMAEAAGTV